MFEPSLAAAHVWIACYYSSACFNRSKTTLVWMHWVSVIPKLPNRELLAVGKHQPCLGLSCNCIWSSHTNAYTWTCPHPCSMPGYRNTAWLLPGTPVLPCLTVKRQRKDSGVEPGPKSLPAPLEPLTPDHTAVLQVGMERWEINNLASDTLDWSAARGKHWGNYALA